MGKANSAVCVYNMEEIAAVFDNSPYKGQTGVTSLWLSAEQPADPPRPGAVRHILWFSYFLQWA